MHKIIIREVIPEDAKRLIEYTKKLAVRQIILPMVQREQV